MEVSNVYTERKSQEMLIISYYEVYIDVRESCKCETSGNVVLGHQGDQRS